MTVLMRQYDTSDPLSIFSYSGGLLGHSLSEVIPLIDNSLNLDDVDRDGKGGLGQLVEKHYFGYEPNSDPRPDFPEAGVELKVSPLKNTIRGGLSIKERLVCDMIDYFGLAEEEFEDSRFFRKSMLMLILFYLHVSGCPRRDLRFIYSVLWRIKDKDLLIIKNDFLTIRDKVRKGLAHELSEGDTLYLGACRKGQKGQTQRKQPYSSVLANARAFSLKPAYMRTILDFVTKSGKSMASNLSDDEMPGIELVSAAELKIAPFETVLRRRFEPYLGKDYKQIASMLGVDVKASDKGKYANIVRQILLKGLVNEDQAEEIRKSGIKIKTLRLQKDGSVREHMSFEQINYREVLEAEDWVDSRWYEIVTTRYMFVVFREEDAPGWESEPRYVLDKMFFWTMAASDYPVAEEYWNNIRENVLADTLLDKDGGEHANTFWRLKDHRFFHVRPKARNSSDMTRSPVSGMAVPKKAYWFENSYLQKEIKAAYGNDWNKFFNGKQENE